MSHTPGPWSWWTSNSHKRLTAEGKQDGGVLSAVSASGHADVRVSEQDARLIAAAPDLLEALQFVMSATGEQLSTAFEQAQVAIAKATGEQA